MRKLREAPPTIVPSAKSLESLAKMLYEKAKQERNARNYASVKTVLSLVGTGALLATSLIAPKPTYLLAKKLRKNKDLQELRRFNQSYLRQTLHRLAKQKLVQIEKANGKERITITISGKQKIIEFALQDLQVKKQAIWDGKWRIVIYDIPQKKKALQRLMREALKNLGFLSMQESVYIIPYPCYKQIEFLREHCIVGAYLKYLLVEKIEDDALYRTYFDL